MLSCRYYLAVGSFSTTANTPYTEYTLYGQNANMVSVSTQMSDCPAEGRNP